MNKHLLKLAFCFLPFFATTIGGQAAEQVNENLTNSTDTTMDTLTTRQQHLAALAALEAEGRQDLLEPAIAAALEAGVPVNDIKEAFSQLYAYTGFPRSLNALACLQRVEAQRAAANIKDAQGNEASPLPADFDALKAGTAVQTKLTGKPYHYDYVPATDYYLKAHLFGDIFGRDNLTPADRELVTVSALSGLERVSPQLQAHVRGAKNMGLTDSEIKAIPAALRAANNDMAAYRAQQAIAAVYGEPFTEVLPLGRTTFPKGAPNTAYAKYFIGNSYLAPLSTGEVPISNVTFEPGCRNNWHIHHKGIQVLIVVSGRGWYAEWGKTPRELHAGDVVEIPEGVKHWHGAARDSWFQHIAFMKAEPGATNEWLEPVSDEEYGQLK